MDKQLLRDNLIKFAEQWQQAVIKISNNWRNTFNMNIPKKNITGTGIPYIEELFYEKVLEDAIVPEYATEGDSGMDIYSVSPRFIIPGANIAVRTGLKFGIPQHPNHILGYRWEIQVRPRSGVSLRTFMRVSNSPGTIDNFYQDEVEIIVSNLNPPSMVLGIKNKTITLEEERVGWVYNLKGEQVSLENLGYYEDNYNKDNTVPLGTYYIGKHERFAQIVFNEVIQPIKKTEAKLDEVYDITRHRGSKLGGTGI